ncbi:MAG TPA: hypothetical protein VG820_13705, partial [Fimbriimonadaceae bacterium]|nr:hypothetical protein [Fimbriimonadaceae bacterium]
MGDIVDLRRTLTGSPTHLLIPRGKVLNVQRIDFVTLFPEMILGALNHSIMKRAEEARRVSFGTSNPRDYTTDKHRTVDDSPFGGGPGMLMKAEP